MESIEKYQKQLLEFAQHIYTETPISEATQMGVPLVAGENQWIVERREAQFLRGLNK